MDNIIATCLFCSNGGTYPKGKSCIQKKCSQKFDKDIKASQPDIESALRIYRDEDFSHSPTSKTFDKIHLTKTTKPKITLLPTEHMVAALKPDKLEWIRSIKDHCKKSVFDDEDEDEELITLNLNNHLYMAEQLSDGYSLKFSSVIHDQKEELNIQNTLIEHLNHSGRYLIAYRYLNEEKQEQTQTFILQVAENGNCVVLSDVPDLVDDLEEFDSTEAFILRILGESFDEELEFIDLYQNNGRKQYS
ncbi:hypothetical protein [Endozoicomonas elysicola]|uniref:Uncharacterized protein n=1 Tax=Endozoicomonas elysicola TaxID=305900 RepID=A0A081KDZ7_9GAMM|nr:hypothetical protein [Endozoicomonas elysicola]KEI72373.1 hypothetical protein GV64_18015 [Endozoicomonas elysicola]